MRCACFVFFALFFWSSLVGGTVYYKGCQAEADTGPDAKSGWFYELCVKNEKFTGRQHAWHFVDTEVSKVEFHDCIFSNTEEREVNFTNANFQDVSFFNTTFASLEQPKPLVVQNFGMKTVLFDNCRFDKSAGIQFKSFSMSNITFRNCVFESDTLFESASMAGVNFIGSTFARSKNAKMSSENNALRFNLMTINRLSINKSKAQYPVVFSDVQAGDTMFGGTDFAEFWCHNRVDSDRAKLATSAFNDTTFDKVTFRDRIECRSTTWRRMTMLNATILSDADFSKSNIEDIFWDDVRLPKPFESECTTLDLSNGEIKRKLIANVTAACQIDLSKTNVRKTWLKNVKARDFIFKDTTFHQGFVDGKCCTGVCPTYGCRCNYTRSSTDICPVVNYPIDLNGERPVCFPSSALLHTMEGTVRMADVRHGTQAIIGDRQYSTVYLFTHRMPEAIARFIRISHSGSRGPLTISPRHYVFVNDRLTTAESVRVGNILRGENGYKLTVTKVEEVVDVGLYAPTSMHGDLIVDGVRVSSYTSALHPTLAHRLLAPLRIAHRFGLRRFVERISLLHERSFEPLARSLRIPEGPAVV